MVSSIILPFVSLVPLLVFLASLGMGVVVGANMPRTIHYRKMCTRWESAGSRFGRCFIIPDHYHNSAVTYLAMFAVARQDFPTLDLDDVECSVVVQSHWCKGMPIIEFSMDPDAIPASYREHRSCSDFQPA